jgi:hypothetical protein
MFVRDGEDFYIYADQDCAHAEWVFAFGECGGVCEDCGDGEGGRGAYFSSYR